MKFTILVDPSLVIIATCIYPVLFFFIFAQEKQRAPFLENCISFTLFTPKLSPLGVSGDTGHEIYNSLSPNHTDTTNLRFRLYLIIIYYMYDIYTIVKNNN